MKLTTESTEKAKKLAKTASIEMLSTFGYSMLLMWAGCLSILGIALKLNVMSTGFVGGSAFVTAFLIHRKFTLPRNRDSMLRLRDGMVALKNAELEQDRKK